MALVSENDSDTNANKCETGEWDELLQQLKRTQHACSEACKKTQSSSMAGATTTNDKISDTSPDSASDRYRLLRLQLL